MGLLDKLPKSLPFLQKNETREYYFSLNIGTQKITAAVWGISGKQLEIVNIGEYLFKAEQSHINYEHLIEGATVALDKALADFEPEPTQILFGVPDNWLQDENLKDGHLKLLKHVVKELDVTPMAYVSTTHAITHLLQKVQGVPPTAILIGVAQSLVVTVVKAGKIVGTKVVKRSEELAEDIQRGLLAIDNIEVLPSRILLYDGSGMDGKLAGYKDELQGFAWMQKLPFLHLPKVETLSDTIEIEGISLAGAVELNPDVAYKPQNIEAHKGESGLKRVVAPAGFVRGDIEQMQDGEIEDPTSDEQLNLVENEIPVRGIASRRDQGITGVEHDDYFPQLPRGGIAGVLTGVISSVSRFIPRKFMPRGTSMTTLVLLLPFLLIVGAVLGYLFLPKAEVKVYVDPRILEKEAQITADPNIASVDEEGKKIPGKIIEIDSSGTGSGQATGRKQIGDPAKGKVVLYNATSQAVSLASGTVLVSDSGIKFKLDTSVQIASKSASAADPASKSSSVGATAVELGPEGNLAAGSDLKVGSFTKSEVVAKIDEAFSGGTSKEVTVVTADDQKKLLAQVSSELRKKAKEELQGKLTGDLKVLEEGLSEQITKTSYSKGVNDQANEFSLTLSAKYKGTAYSEGDLKSIISKLVITGVPDGYELRLAESETQSAVSKLEKDGRLIFGAKFRARLIPKLDIEKIKSTVKGKTPITAGESLKGIEHVIGSDIQISPSLPGPLQRLPIIQKNINVEVTTK